MGLSTILFLIFLVLKLMGEIDWSWWWVTAPLWIEALVAIIVFFIIGLGVKKSSDTIKSNRRNYF